MPSFSQFRTGVLGFYNPGGTMSQLAYDAIASYVKYKIEREVNQDLERSKSYYNTFLERKLMLAGVTPPIFSVAKPEVLVRITIDAQRVAIASFVDEYIQEGIDDLAGATNSFEAFLRGACIDIQRKVICYQSNNKSYFNLSNTTTTGRVSVIDISVLPGINVLGLSSGRYEAPLTAQAYVADDEVQSNGRIYSVSTPGTVVTVGTGLQSIDGKEEFIDGVGFKYEDNMRWTPIDAFDWLQQDQELNGREPGGPYYTIDPNSQNVYVYPMLVDAKRQVRLEYNGIKQTFTDVDVVPYDVKEQEVVAHYIKGYLALNITQDQKKAQTELALYTAGVRRLWVDCQRQQSTTLSR